MTTVPAVRFCQSFKKYTSEFRPDVIAFARDYVRAKPGVVVYEDASLVKLTADQATIESLRTALAEKFPGWTAVGIEGADGKKKA